MVVTEQAPDDGHKFARGRLLNAGARLATTRWPSVTTLVLHDVDLLMDVDRASQVIMPALQHGEIRALNTDSAFYKDAALYIGGVCAVTTDTFVQANGFQNAFEGWGGEDDCLRDAIRTVFRDRFLLTQATRGSVRDVAPVPYRCALDLEAKMPKADRKAIKARAAEGGFASGGLRQLLFSTPKGPDSWVTLGPACFFVRVHVFPGDLPPGWEMAMSNSTSLPYYFSRALKVSQFLWPSS